MFRKTIAALAMTLMLTIMTAGAASAQMLGGVGQVPEAALAEMQKEGPLTQADVDIYIKLLPTMGQAMTGGADGLKSIHEASGLSEVRLSMVMTKVALSQALASGLTMEQLNAQQIPDVMKPTDAEVELVKKNMDKLNKATMELQSNMQKQQQK